MLVDRRLGRSSGAFVVDTMEIVSSCKVACDVLDVREKKEVPPDDDMGMLTGAKTEKSDEEWWLVAVGDCSLSLVLK
jgi:hypothetical protein